ncbi:MAG: type II toxin-antitoxin system RelE/ParE family toxin [Pseudomonadales bacterium]|jgi:proteic killer suppression protein
MIKSWKHKGLKLFFETGTAAGINPKHAAKLMRQLDRLDAAVCPQDMHLPGWRWHGLRGDEAGTYAVSVNGNWRLTYRFEGGNAIVVDYRDYH